MNSNNDDVSWTSITAENQSENQQVTAQLPPLPETKKKGRQPNSLKRQNTVSVLAATPTPTPTILKESWLPDPITNPESYIPTSHLIDAFEQQQQKSPKSPRSKSPLRKSVTIDDDNNNNTPDDEGRLTLIALYNEYFSNPRKMGKHSKQKRTWTNKNTCAEIKCEIDAMDNEVSGFNPGLRLAESWALAMQFIAEPALKQIGYNTTNLGNVCHAMIRDPKSHEAFGRLLVKYPSLRRFVELGNFPEIDVLLLMIGTVKMTHDKNTQGSFIPGDPVRDRQIQELLDQFERGVPINNKPK